MHTVLRCLPVLTGHHPLSAILRGEDSALMALIELALILIYMCVLLIKSCFLSTAVCATYGFGDTPKGNQFTRLRAHWSLEPRAHIFEIKA
jgi:hypothetical protein